MSRKILFGTGYHQANYGPRFSDIWEANTVVQSHDKGPIVCVSVDGAMPVYGPAIQVIWLRNNLGHVGDLLNGTKPHEFCGWSAAVLALAMIAYCNESDLIYKEADCLAFGDWVEELYATGGMVSFGKSATMACAQSLFLVRHEYIPSFVSEYIRLGSDARTQMLPEDKFAALEKCYPEAWRRFDMGVDRDRPDGWINRPTFYVQHLTSDELTALKEKGLI